MNIVQPWTCICSFGFSMSNSTYLAPTIVMLGGLKYRGAAQRHDMAIQIIRHGYNIFLVKTLSQWQPNVHVARNKLLHGTVVSKQHFHSARILYDDVWQSPVSFSSSLVSGVALLCLTEGFQSKLFAETFRKNAGTYCCTF